MTPWFDSEVDRTFNHDEILISDSNTVNRKGYLRTGRVVVPRFEVYSSPTVNIGDVAKRRFSLIDRYGGKKNV